MAGKLKWTPEGPQAAFKGSSRPETVLYWIKERHRIACGGGSADELIKRGRFCSVRRQDDRQTRWVFEHWLTPNRGDVDLWFLALVFRACINDGRVAGELSTPLPWNALRYVSEMQARKAQGKLTEHYGHHAYTIYAYRGYAEKYAGHAECLLSPAWESREHFRPRPEDNCASFYERLRKLSGVGPFIAGQVVADAKFFPPLCDAPDVMTFAVPGPGSERGLARVRGKPLGFYKNNDAQWQRDFKELIEQLTPEIEQILGSPLSASDFQSALCEVDKMERYRTDHGEIQLYAPYGETPPKKARAPRTAKPAVEAPQPAPVAAPHVIPELAAQRDPHAPHVLHHDFETRSRLDIRQVGAWRYATDPSTEVLCLAYAVDAEPVQLWIPGDPVPIEFVEAARNPTWLIVAHGDGFERAISTHIMAPRYGWPLVPIERRRCSMAGALAQALPPALDDVAAALGLEHRKDAQGHRVMQLMARPKPGGGWYDDAERREKLYAYCRQDVEVERELWRRIPQLSSEEQALWELDAAINDRGLHLDGELLDGALRVAEAAERGINDELKALTCGAVDTVDKRDKLQAWLAAHACVIANMQKGTLKRALTRKNIPPGSRRAIELRLDGAHASARKLQTMRGWRAEDGRARGWARYHGASTGRWTSFGIQLQNLKRPETEDLGAAIAAVATGDLDQVRRISAQPMSVVGDISRALICAAPGHRLIAADFSGVESRVTAWVSGQQSKLDQWAKFDRTQDPADEPYAILGRQFGIPPERARDVGKTADLAFGYMGSVGAWRRLADDDETPDDQIKSYQQAWRNAHPQTCRFWREIDGAAIRAMRAPGQVVTCGRVAFKYEGDFLRMRLPSARKIVYPFPKLIANKFGDPAISFMDYAQGRWVECRHGFGAYGGTWIENAVQAVARDVFAAAMQRVEAAGYQIVLHVHDEICCEVPDGFGTAEEFLQLVTTPPPWADGLPIAAKVRNGARFCKISAAPETTTPVEPLQPQVGFSGGAEIPGEANERMGEPPIGSPFEYNPAAGPLVQFSATAPVVTTTGSTNGGASSAQANHGDDYRGNGYASGERPWGRNVATYVYRDERGEPCLKVTRTSEKQFPQAWRVNGQWVHKKPSGWVDIPYRLPELLAAAPQVPIFICEGEKDADNVAALGLIATTNPGGALKWSADLGRCFAGKQTAYILEDNDNYGALHALRVAEALHAIVPHVAIVKFRESKKDVSDWLELGHTREELMARAQAAPKFERPPLPFIDMSSWDSEPIPDQEWTVPFKIPAQECAIFSGEGGAGKSMEGLHLCAAHVLGSECWHTIVQRGPAIFIDAEDTKTVIHRRLDAVRGHYGVTFADLIKGGLHLMSLVGYDAVLATCNRSGKIEPTPLYQQLLQAAGDIKPVQMVIASSANVFAGNENDRSQAQQFISLLARLAMTANGSCVLISHPSLTGINSGSGLSGSTAWHNAVRARFVMRGIKSEEGEQPNDDLREIEFKKSQHSALSESIVVRYQNGMFLPVNGASLDQAAREVQANETFLDLLHRFTRENRFVSGKPSSNYAPALFAKEDEAKREGLTSKAFEGAMRRLFKAGTIWNEPCGKPSRPSYRIAVKTGG